jgi:hypothetical protein
MDFTDDELRDLGELFDTQVTFGRETWLGERRVFVGESGLIWLTYDSARQLVAAYRSGRIQRSV